MRTVHLEGGPSDGEQAVVTDWAQDVIIPLRSPSAMMLNPLSLFLPIYSRRGLYRQDPLDPFTMIWDGEY